MKAMKAIVICVAMLVLSACADGSDSDGPVQSTSAVVKTNG